MAKASKTGHGQIEAAFPLSPLQQGMLFHSLENPEAGLYLVQRCRRLIGPLDVTALKAAWQQLVDRHDVLRSSMTYKKKAPIQVVMRRATLRWAEKDWRRLDAATRWERRQRLLAEDRRRGFRLNQAPLMRMTLIRMEDELHELIFTFHHLLLDGWSVGILNREFAELYDALLRGATPELPPAPRYRDYVAWLGAQDQARAEAFWRRQLAGFHSPTRLSPVPRSRAEGTVAAVRDRPLAAADLARWTQQARALGVTLNTLTLGAWALLLSRWSGRRDVVFGFVVSGRPPDLPGAMSMVGLLINTLPLRVQIDVTEPVRAWLRSLQARQA